MKLFVFLGLATVSLPLYAADIATCSNPTGKAYYPETGIVAAKDSGWTDEKITGGITKLSKIGDIRKEIISARQDGGQVVLLNRGKNAVSVLVVYRGKTAEIYTFLKNNSGKLEYVYTLSKAGDAVLITKATVMRGDCDYINFGAL